MLTFDDMFRYYLFIGLILLQSFIFYAKKPTNVSNFAYFFLVFMELFAIMGLRSSSVGFDTDRYLYLFDYIRITSEVPMNYMESGFLKFNYFLTLISSANQILLIVSGFIIVLPIIFFIHKYSKIPWLSVYIYIQMFFLFQMSAMRQSIAMVFILFSFYFIEKRKIILFLILIIIASQFHISALLFVPAYFLFNTEFSKKNITMLSCIAIGLFVFFHVFSDFLLKIFPKYEIYLEGSWKNEDMKIASVFKTIIAGGFVFIGTIFWFNIIKPLKHKMETQYYIQTRFLLWLSFVAFLIQFISINATQLARVSLYFSFFNIILFPNLIYLIKERNIKILLIGMFVFFILVYTTIILLYRNAWVGCLPYTFFWEI